ncbi:MAG TPA: hypothetical protein VGV14_13905, partial [Rhodanobacter sp.]|nr:hypothetical protein [Rhodanobacter sp.]
FYNSQESHREEVIQEGARNGTPVDIVRRTYANPSISWKDYWTPLYDTLLWDQYRKSAKFAYDGGIIRRKITAEEILEPRFMKAGLAALNLENYWQPWIGDTPPQQQSSP